MEILIPITAGVLVAAGLSLLLRRNMLSVFVGLVVLAHAVNLLIFASGDLTRGEPPIIDPHAEAAPPPTDPLPQALVLTAIVIGLGVQSFLLVLIYRLVQIKKTADLDEVRATEGTTPEETS